MNKLPVILATVLAGGLAVSALAQTSMEKSESRSKTTSAHVTLNQLNKSKETGVATLTALPGNKTRVVIDIRGEFPTANQPAHIHEGPCSRLNPAPKYPLNNVRHGRSVTVVNASLASLMKGHYAINVHKSARQINQYVACGDIKAGTVSTTTTKQGGMSKEESSGK